MNPSNARGMPPARTHKPSGMRLRDSWMGWGEQRPFSPRGENGPRPSMNPVIPIESRWSPRQMNEHDAFIRAVIEDPYNDLPRLVFADWLDEHDESDRAWFIRFQCNPAGYSIDSAEREYNLVEKHIEDWFGLSRMRGTKRTKLQDWHLSDHFSPNLVFNHGRATRRNPTRPRCEIAIRRGFFQSIEDCRLSWWLERGPRLVREHPIVQVKTDRRPTPHPPVSSNGETSWTWLEGDALSAVSAFHLPSIVYRMLEGRVWSTEREATMALSNALTAWAKDWMAEM